MKRKLIAGNWKMNGGTEANEALVRALIEGMGDAACTVAVCVPAPYLAQVNALRAGSRLELGAQDVSEHVQGAYTGEVSGAMLKEFGVRYVIVGHSERRQYHGETDAVVADKTKVALAAGITPIVCVGETLAERDGGQTLSRVGTQVDAVFAELAAADALRCVVAYEPVWAIGTGRNATPAQAEEVHKFIRGRLAERVGEQAKGMRILYGGSVKPDNTAALMNEVDIDGALVGGASLEADTFARIVNYK